MTPKDRVKVVHFDDQAHSGIAAGVEIMREAVGKTFGPGGRNVLIKKKYVAPIHTRDGVTVARDIAGHGNRLPDDDANMAAQLVYQASEKTNKTAGDGTTNTVVLLAAVYQEGHRQIVAGEDAMVVKRKLERNARAIVKFVESKSVKCDKAMLRQVATISAGDAGLGDMISDLMQEVGLDGTVNITYHNAPIVEVEQVKGYLFDQGVRYLAQETILEQPLVLVTQKRIAARAEIIPILEAMRKINRPFVIIGDVTGAAYETFLAALQNPEVGIVGVTVNPPAFGQDGHDYFEDIAAYTGAKVFLEARSFSSLTMEDLGEVQQGRFGRERVTLFGADEIVRTVERTYEVADENGQPKLDVRQEEEHLSLKDMVAERIKQIQEQLKSTEVTPSLKETLDRRIAKLAGKVSVIKVGAPTENGREELYFRVEDAVEACKSALATGVVAGGATTLLFASEITTDEGPLDPFVVKALQAPIRLLMGNAAEDGGYRLQQVLAKGYGYGFNLREMTKEPSNLIKTGIVDPTRVITEAVVNAFDIAGNLLTTGATITEVDENEPEKQA